jgi:hypothetical protein
LLYNDASDVEYVYIVNVLQVGSHVEFAEMARDVEGSVTGAQVGSSHEHNSIPDIRAIELVSKRRPGGATIDERNPQVNLLS